VNRRLVYLVATLGRAVAAEVVFAVARLLPRALRVLLLRPALWLNPHNLAAALLLIETVPSADAPAFAALRNPWRRSASDLAVINLPSRVTDFLWPYVPAAALPVEWREIWRVAHATAAVEPMREGEFDALSPAERSRVVVEAGFRSPCDALSWGTRLLELGRLDDAARCAGYARVWFPELAETWIMAARVATARGEDAHTCWQRAASLCPENLDARLGLRRRAAPFLLGLPTPGAAATPTSAAVLDGIHACSSSPQTNAPLSDGNPRLRVTLEAGGDDFESDTGSRSASKRKRRRAAALQIGDTLHASVVVDGEGRWTVAALPPAGWGVVATPVEVEVDGGAAASFTLQACRPDRLRGGPWPVKFVAIHAGHQTADETIYINVPDPRPPRILIAITEDHELQEERGSYQAADLESLIVNKSTRAAGLCGVPWTHMVEVGSAVDVPAWAAERSLAWRGVSASHAAHLGEELARGNDVQAHLHAFNRPGQPGFPFWMEGDELRVEDRFLATPAAARGAWAHGVGGRERIDMLAAAVRELEGAVLGGLQGDSSSPRSHRVLVWRSGLLETGDDDADRAWTMVALRRAGLIACSDISKPASPLATAKPAFISSHERPFEPATDGTIVQMPIAVNLEGDYLMGPAALAVRAHRSVAAIEDTPGVHLFTLLTHDKFLGARAGGDEWDLGPDTFDVRCVRRHVAAWQEAGAEFVTASQGALAVLADRTWTLQGILWPEAEYFRLEFYGDGIPVSPEYPHHVPVTVPPVAREGVTAVQIHREGGVETVPIEHGVFWLCVTDRQPLKVTLVKEGAPEPVE
jgi:hypothetical protein